MTPGPPLSVVGQHHEIARVEVAMDEDLRLQQRFVDEELERDGQQRALFGRELEPEMFAEEPLGHEIELALERRAVVGRQRRCGAAGPAPGYLRAW